MNPIEGECKGIWHSNDEQLQHVMNANVSVQCRQDWSMLLLTCNPLRLQELYLALLGCWTQPWLQKVRGRKDLTLCCRDAHETQQTECSPVGSQCSCKRLLARKGGGGLATPLPMKRNHQRKVWNSARSRPIQIFSLMIILPTLTHQRSDCGWNAAASVTQKQ